MKFATVFALVVIGSAVAFPSWPWKRQASGNGIQDDGSNWPQVQFTFDLKFSKLRKFWTHIIKSYVDADIITTYFGLPDADRQCIEHFMENKTNYDNTTEDQQLAAMKAACPNAANTIDTLNTEIKAMVQKYTQQYQDFLNKMPQSIQAALTQLNNAFVFLYKNQTKDKDVVRQTLVLAFQALLNIPAQDLQTAAANYPYLAPILTGAQSGAVKTLLNAAIESLNTGKVADEQAVKTAWEQIAEFLKNLLKEILNDIDHHTEVQLPANVDTALKTLIGNHIAKSFQDLAKIPFLKVNVDQANDTYEISI